MRQGNWVPNTGWRGNTLTTWIMNHWLSSIVSMVIHQCSDLIQFDSQVPNVTPALCVDCESEEMFCTMARNCFVEFVEALVQFLCSRKLPCSCIFATVALKWGSLSCCAERILSFAIEVLWSLSLFQVETHGTAHFGRIALKTSQHSETMCALNRNLFMNTARSRKIERDTLLAS